VPAHSVKQEILDVLTSQQGSWDVDDGDQDEAEQLLAEASAYMLPPPTSEQEKGIETKSIDNNQALPDWLGGDTLDPVKSEIDEEDNILQRIRDEIEFEAAHGIAESDEREEDDRPQPQEGPSPEGEVGEVDETLLKRFEALGGLELPAVPKIEPGTKLKPHFTIAAPDKDDETDTWCCKSISSHQFHPSSAKLFSYKVSATTMQSIDARAARMTFTARVVSMRVLFFPPRLPRLST
jgi:hypothetical protein